MLHLPRLLVQFPSTRCRVANRQHRPTRLPGTDIHDAWWCNSQPVVNCHVWKYMATSFVSAIVWSTASHYTARWASDQAPRWAALAAPRLAHEPYLHIKDRQTTQGHSITAKACQSSPADSVKHQFGFLPMRRFPSYGSVARLALACWRPRPGAGFTLKVAGFVVSARRAVFHNLTSREASRTSSLALALLSKSLWGHY